MDRTRANAGCGTNVGVDYHSLRCRARWGWVLWLNPWIDDYDEISD